MSASCLSFSSVDTTQQLIQPSLTLPPLSLPFTDVSKSHLSAGSRPIKSRGTSYPSPPMSKSPTPTNRSFDEYAFHYTHGQEENARHLHEQKLCGPNHVHEQRGSIRPPLITVPSQQYLQTLKPPSFPVLGSSLPTQAPGKAARRTKQHVQSACFNCKKAHLSCDVARPCNRCVSSGKCDTCCDVPHKKRGRPRLVRDERGFRTQPARAQQERPANLSLAIPTQPHISQGRQDLRMLRPQDEGRQMASDPYRTFDNNPAFTFQAPYQPRFMNTAPMAFLDLEMKIIRTNQAMNNLLGNGNDVCGANLDQFVVDKQALYNLKLRIKDEKEEVKEPSYLPPLGMTDVPCVETADIGRLTQGYTDRAEQLTFLFPNGQMALLTINLRLARTSCFFITLVLPETMQPAPQAMAQPRSAQVMPQGYPYSAALSVPNSWSGLRISPQPASPYYIYASGISPNATPPVNGSRNGSGSFESYFNPSLTSPSYPMYTYNMGQQTHMGQQSHMSQQGHMVQQPNMGYDLRQQQQAHQPQLQLPSATSELQLPPLASAAIPGQRRETVQMGPDATRWRVDSAIDLGFEPERLSKRQRLGVHDMLG